MNLFMLILTILQIFLKLPDIWKTIKEIMDMIKLLRGEEQKVAKDELKSILARYRAVKRSDKQQVETEGAALRKELDALKSKLKSKVA